MTARLAHIWRHPVKGIGSEAVESVELSPNTGVVGDRAWALLNAAADDSDDWQPRRNFLQVASGPKLAQIGAMTSGDTVLLTHPDRAPLSLDPTHAPDALGHWIGDLWPNDRPGPARLIKAPEQGMTDVPYPSVSIGNLSSLRALSQRAGMEIDMRRFRINLWLDGLAPWEEIDLLNRPFKIGGVTLTPEGPIERCRAPDASPSSGARDIGMLRVLEEGWNTRDFGIYVRVAAPGTVRLNDILA